MLSINVHAVPALRTTDIIKAAADKDCLDYRVRGVCLWLHCSSFGCQVRSSERIEHYLPDAVVLVYSEEPAWSVVNALQKGLSASLKLGGGGWGLGFSNVRFYHAAVIGSPALEVINTFSGVLPLCTSAAQALEPYFISDADSLAWRFSLTPEENALHDKRVVGQGTNVWGPLIPRTGFITQAHATKAASVIAQRAADIVVRQEQKHVYRYLPTDCGKGCSGPPPLKENTDVGGKWQRLHPSHKSCEIFGEGAHEVNYGDGYESYAWHLWRPYRCCKPKGQILLQIIESDSS